MDKNDLFYFLTSQYYCYSSRCYFIRNTYIYKDVYVLFFNIFDLILRTYCHRNDILCK